MSEPVTTTTTLAKQLDLSRERIRQIAQRLGVVPAINQFGAAEFTDEQAAMIINRPKLKGGRPKKAEPTHCGAHVHTCKGCGDNVSCDGSTTECAEVAKYVAACPCWARALE